MAPRRHCIEAGCPFLALPGEARCASHIRARRRARGTTTQQGYGWAHQQARAQLGLGTGARCWCCGAPATEADHWPPLAVRAVTSRRLRPACQPCNRSHCAQARWDDWTITTCPRTSPR
jgi:hypothetical protein